MHMYDVSLKKEKLSMCMYDVIVKKAKIMRQKHKNMFESAVLIVKRAKTRARCVVQAADMAHATDVVRRPMEWGEHAPGNAPDD